MTSTDGIATERHRHKQPNTKNREKSVMCLCVSGHLVIKVCDTFTCSLSSTPLPLFQHFPVSPSAFHFLFSSSPLLFSEAGVQWLLDLLSIWFSCLSFPSRSFPFLLPPFFYSVYLSPNSFCLF